MKLTGKTALITGGASGIGAEIVRLFAKEGADIAINYHSRASQAELLAEECRKDGGRIITVKADVSEPEPVQAMVEEVLKAFGKVDILVNCQAFNLVE